MASTAFRLLPEFGPLLERQRFVNVTQTQIEQFFGRMPNHKAGRVIDIVEPLVRRDQEDCFPSVLGQEPREPANELLISLILIPYDYSISLPHCESILFYSPALRDGLRLWERGRGGGWELKKNTSFTVDCVHRTLQYDAYDDYREIGRHSGRAI